MRRTNGAILVLVLAIHAGCKEPKGNDDSVIVTESKDQTLNDIGIASFAIPDG